MGRSGMRMATFTVNVAGHTGLCTVTRMGTAAGNLEANVRRWLGQVGISEPDATALKSFLDRQRSFQSAGGLPCVLVDLTDLPETAADGETMIAGLFALEDATLFAKLMGPRPLLDAQRAAFETFCRSFGEADTEMPGVFHRLLGLLGSLKITVLGLFLLMVLTIWGTLYQAEHGLYSAQERFYQSWSFPLAGPIPFPGAQTVMLLLFINLAASLAFMALTRRLRVGFIATHAGLALMLAAGGVTFYFGRSANLSLAEGEAANVALSSQEWELAMMPANSGPQRVVSALDARQLRPGRRIPLPGTEFALHIDSYHRNCIASRAATANAPVNGAGHTTLVRKPPAGEPGEDRPGMIATLEERGKERGRILLWGGDPTPTALPGDRETMVIGLRRLHMPLPATIRLLDFRRELHPGTGMARSYSSQVSVEGSTESARKVLISMNKPLRIGGYTFYQSSFASGPGGSEVSTLAVVRNQARLLPYYATGLTGLGMLIHFTGLLLIRLRQPTRETPS